MEVRKLIIEVKDPNDEFCDTNCEWKDLSWGEPCCNLFHESLIIDTNESPLVRFVRCCSCAEAEAEWLDMIS